MFNSNINMYNDVLYEQLEKNGEMPYLNPFVLVYF